MTTTTGTTTTSTTTPGTAFSDVIGSAIDLMGRKVDDWTDKLNDVAARASGDPSAAVDGLADDVAEGGGAGTQAGVRGVQAGLEGRNPVWAAIKGAWTGSGPGVKTAIVVAGVALILLLVLSPVLLVVMLVTLPVVVIVSRARSAKKK